MYEVTMSYSNADGLFRLDDEIREAMSRTCEEVDNWQDRRTHTRHLMFEFDSEADATSALDELAIYLEDRFAEITWSGEEAEERELVMLPLGLDPDLDGLRVQEHNGDGAPSFVEPSRCARTSQGGRWPQSGDDRTPRKFQEVTLGLASSL